MVESVGALASRWCIGRFHAAASDFVRPAAPLQPPPSSSRRRLSAIATSCIRTLAASIANNNVRTG